MMKKTLFFLPIILLLSAACSFLLPPAAQGIEQPGPGLSPTFSQVAFTPTAQATLTPTRTPQPTLHVATAGEVRRQWAENAVSDLPYADVEQVNGDPNSDACDPEFVSWFGIQPDPARKEFTLHLWYAYPVVPSEVNLVMAGSPDGQVRVELMDSHSGLSIDVFEGSLPASDDCPFIHSIPVQTERSFDSVILTFQNTQQPFLMDAVELVGILPGYSDVPVFWRIPIPADSPSDPDSQFPGGLAVDPLGRLFLANGRMGLYQYDVEGNRLYDYPVPAESNVNDVAVDRFENLVITDSVYNWFVTFSFDGEQLNAGGEDFGWNGPKEVAISPLDGNAYLLDATDEYARIRVYTLDTVEWVRDFSLDSGGSDRYAGLVFDAMGNLYTLDKQQAVISKIDAVSGEMTDALGYIPLAGAGLQDLAVDQNGNFYVLVNHSRDDSAVLILDPQGDLLHRLGNLSYDCADHSEGTFCFPVSIAVTADGKFLFIVENGFLTAYLLEQ